MDETYQSLVDMAFDMQDAGFEDMDEYVHYCIEQEETFREIQAEAEEYNLWGL